jgi:hypothetical protein
LLFNKLHIIIIKVALIIGLPFYSCSQEEQENLVINPGFEEIDTCMASINIFDWNSNNIDFMTGWHNFYMVGSPGYFSTCPSQYSNSLPTIPYNTFNNSFQSIRKNGNNHFFAGLFNANSLDFQNITNSDVLFKETLTGSFTKSLTKGTYYFQFYINFNVADENVTVATDALDLVLFREKKLLDAPQSPFITNSDIVWSNKSGNFLFDTLNWVKVSGCFSAEGGENYFSLGSFRDDIRLKFFGPVDNSIYYEANYLFDDFLIYQCDTCCPDQYPVEDYITVNNNLITQGETATFETFLNEGHTANLYLFDSAGRIVYQAKLNGTDNSHQIPYNLAAGVYHYAMVTSEKKKLGGKIVVL